MINLNVIPVKSILRLCSVFLMASGLTFLLRANEGKSQDQPLDDALGKPNIILIMADDVSWECFGSYGAEDYETPNLDRLAAEGVQFDHCYSTPLCTPSRVMIMTGKYNFRNYTHFGYLNPQEKTFGHLLQEVGYKTAIAGKWQLNGIHHEAEGNQDTTRPLKAGFDESMLWQVTKGKRVADGGGERFWNPPLEHNGKFIPGSEHYGKYGPDLMTNFICDFMEKHQDNPFFVYYPMVLVHDPFVPTPDTIGDADLETANIEPKDPAAKKRHFVSMVNYMDKLVGKIVAKVDELELSEETLILFTADNGTDTKITSNWNGRKIAGGKGGQTDMGTRVPLIVRWKGRTPAGSVSKDLIEFTDFYATIADAAGIEMAKEDPVDGYSFYPQLMGEPGKKRAWQISHYHAFWSQEHGQYVRDVRYKLYGDGRLIDVANDLEETTDLSDARDKTLLERRLELQSVLDQLPPLPSNGRHGGDDKRLIYPDWQTVGEVN